ncbi:MAG: hypothetical protein WAL56_01655 [Candidatus Sulfotelmatobacter sp.]
MRPFSEGTVRAKLIVLSFSSLLFFAIPGCAQTGPRTPAAQRIDGSVVGPDADDAASRERIAHDMAKKANLERQAALKADTDKLMKLATELKESVDKSNENVLSLDVLKKAEEIEKLAHSVREKMKGPN